MVTNYGTIVWRPGGGTTWYWTSARLENQPSGLLDMQLDGTIFMSSGAGTFNNLGTWRKSSGAGNAGLGNYVAFSNAGAVEVQQGAMVFGYGFTSSGSLSVASNAAIRLTGGTFHLLPGHQFTGSGYYGVPSGAVTLDGPITESNFRMDGGTLTQNSPLSGTLQWASGGLAGSWSIASNGTLNLVTNGVSWGLSGVVTNYGTIVWRPGGGTTWYWTSARLENQPSGVVDLQMDGMITMSSGAGIVNNLGTWRKTGGAGTASIGAGLSITNRGKVSSEKGVLALPAKYTQHDGVLGIAIRATNDYGRITFAGSLSLTGRVEAVIQGGFRPPLGAAFHALSYPSRMGMLEGFNGIDLDHGLRLDPRMDPTSLSFVATAYDTNEVKRVGLSRLPQHVFLWWPVAVTNGELQAATGLMEPSWDTIPATNNNAILPTGVSNRFFCIGGPL